MFMMTITQFQMVESRQKTVDSQQTVDSRQQTNDYFEFWAWLTK